MRTLSIVTLSLSPVGLLLLAGCNAIANGPSAPPVSAAEPETEAKAAQPDLSQPTPNSVESNNQPEFSAGSAQAQIPLAPLPASQPSPLELPPPSQPITLLPARPVPASPSISASISLPARSAELPTIRVDPTKLDRVIARSLESNGDVASTVPTATTAPAPASPAPLLPAPVISTPAIETASTVAGAPASQPASAAPSLPVAIDGLYPQTGFAPTIAPPETLQSRINQSPPSSSVQWVEPISPSETSAVQVRSQSDSLSPQTDETLQASDATEPLSHTQMPGLQASVAPAPEAPVTVQTPSRSAAPAPPASLLSASSNQAYTLGPGDIIRINFFNSPQHNEQLQITSDGTINLPIVGSVSVSDMTLRQASQTIKSRYALEEEHTVVLVSLVQPRSRTDTNQLTATNLRSSPITLLDSSKVGEISRPKPYAIENGAGQLPLLHAVQPGDIVSSAVLDRVELHHKTDYNIAGD